MPFSLSKSFVRGLLRIFLRSSENEAVTSGKVAGIYWSFLPEPSNMRCGTYCRFYAKKSFIKQARHVLKGWVKHFGRSIINEGGYRIVIGIIVTLMGAYAGLYAIVEAKTRAPS